MPSINVALIGYAFMGKAHSNAYRQVSHFFSPRLTPREREIIQLLAEGHRNKKIAQQLGISVKTVETHRTTLMRKIDVRSIVELVRYAVRNHLTEP